MSELEFYKYIKELEPEMRWHNEELLIFLYYFQVEDFMKALGDGGMFDDGGFEAHLKSDYMVVDLLPFCEYYGIKPENILSKKEAR